MPLRLIIATVYDVPYSRVEGSIPILDKTFSARFIAKAVPRKKASRMLQDALCTALSITVKREKREMEIEEQHGSKLIRKKQLVDFVVVEYAQEP